MTIKLKHEHGLPTFLDIMALVFIHYKVTGVVGWSWWVVLMPLWLAPIGLVVLGFFRAIVTRIKDRTEDDLRRDQLAEMMRMAESARKVGEARGPRLVEDEETN